ncbi:MAG: hypothetical protein JNJ46_20225 [Myxococcales bacterium]|nr:hypothetical protein [Myxococcales bacterium]
MSSPSRRTLLRALPLLPFAGLLLGASDAQAVHYAALLCNRCGFGNKKNNCARCGKWIGSSRIAARLCSTHGFGNKKNNCAVCGKWVGSSRQIAFLCNGCGFGNKKNNCVICGKWAP